MSFDRWEARVFNKSVREAFEREGFNTTAFGDKWADAHYIIVFAESRLEAEKIFEQKYPAKNGFVVSDIVNLDRSNSF